MKRINKIKDVVDYNNQQYDEMKSLLDKSRNLFEQREEKPILDRDIEKVEEYEVSSGKIIVHGYSTQDTTLTDEEKNTYQETMDDFVEQVSDLVDYNALNIYENNVEWSGMLVKFDTEFYYTVGERNGVYLSGTMMKLDEDALEMLNNLKDYYQVFSVKWAGVLADRKSTHKIEKENE
jgi:hypothetical protein